ncbi:hypothetical protein HMN09_00932600 [Mycena chlorophos]|uniref:Uncharacterized protein n=1 Tax=Mycena chlorophos TaxID=658473 RepID=A0A8H6SJG9_MYCCL|nr:hypothetical protein HMN09_00932600 [Mycena chlorophos]
MRPSQSPHLGGSDLPAVHSRFSTPFSDTNYYQQRPPSSRSSANGMDWSSGANSSRRQSLSGSSADSQGPSRMGSQSPELFRTQLPSLPHGQISPNAQTILSMASHNDLLTWSPSYLELFRENESLNGKFQVLMNNYNTLATSIPRIFTIIPNPYDIQVPAIGPSLPASLPPTSRPPAIKYWQLSDWTKRPAASGELAVVPAKPSRQSTAARSDDEDDTDSDPGDDASNIDGDEMPGLKKRKTDKLGFLEHDDGSRFTPEQEKHARASAYSIYESFLNDGIAPLKWGRTTVELTTRFRAQIIGLVPQTAYGENYWKADKLATETYPQWLRRKKDKVAAQGIDAEKEKKREMKQAKKERKEEEKKKRKLPDATQDTSSKRRCTNDGKTIPAPALLSDDEEPALSQLISFATNNNHDELLTPPETPLESSAPTFPILLGAAEPMAPPAADKRIPSVERALPPAPAPVVAAPKPKPKFCVPRNPLSRMTAPPAAASRVLSTQTQPPPPQQSDTPEPPPGPETASSSLPLPDPEAESFASPTAVPHGAGIPLALDQQSAQGPEVPSAPHVVPPPPPATTAATTKEKEKGSTYFSFNKTSHTAYNYFGRQYTQGKKKIARKEVKDAFEKLTDNEKKTWKEVAQKAKDATVAGSGSQAQSLQVGGSQVQM